MTLNIWESIREFFYNLIESFSWTSFLTLITGIVIGILICLMFYLVALVKSLKSKEKENVFDSKKIKLNELNISKEEEISLIKKYIQSTKDEFNEESQDLVLNDKVNIMKDMIVDLTVNIAKIYYPNSQHPLCELSIDELIQLDYYIMKRIEKLFDAKILKHFKNLRLSFIMSIIDKKKKVEENNIVKAAKKLNVGGIGKVFKSALNLVNPAYWLKKAFVSVTFEYGFNRIANIIFEIVGEETAKIYSKSAFVIFDESEQKKELEREIIKEIKEEE